MMRPAAGLLGIGPLEAIFLALMAAAGVALVVWLLVRKPKATAAIATAAAVPDSALAIARERLARGDIDADQYFRIVTALHGAATTGYPVADTPPVAGTSAEVPSFNG